MIPSSLQSAPSPLVLASRPEPQPGGGRRSALSSLVGWLAKLWRPLIWFWLTLILSWLTASFITLLATAGQSSTPELPVMRLALEQPWALAAVLGLFALLTPCAYLASRARRPASLYLPGRVEFLKHRAAQFIPHYQEPFYLYRVADAEAREALRAAASRASNEEPFGICVLGPAMMGKTRMAWEAMQVELPDWTLVRWPHEGWSREPQAQLPIDLAPLQGERVILWLDDLAKYAHLSLAPTLNDLPRRLQEAGIPFIIVATCRDGDEAHRAAVHLRPLLERLLPIRPAEIGDNEIAWHAAALKYHGIRLQADQFNGTPGSVMLGAQRMAHERYPALSKSAQRVLRALKLLRSAGIYSYPESRVRATVEDVFGMESSEWRSARRALLRSGFIRLEPLPASREHLLAPVADVYLDEAVPTYTPPGVDISDGWRELEKCLTRRGDADALNLLGLAFLERRVGSISVNKQHAEACFRAAISAYRRQGAHASWAIAQHHLALTHWHQAQTSQADERGVLLAQSVAAYRLALRVGQWENIPLHCAMMLQHLGAALNQQATLAAGEERRALHMQAIASLMDAQILYRRSQIKDAAARAQEDLGVALSEQAHLAETEERAELLGQAITAYRAALEIYAHELPRTNWARTQNNLGIALMQQADLAADDEQHVALMNEARVAHEAALEVATPVGEPKEWANAQCNLGNVLRHQAELAEDGERAALLAQAVSAYRLALKVLTRDAAPDAWAMTQNNLGNALSDQAELEQGGGVLALLGLAAAAHQAALSVYTRAYVPVEWAGTQLNLAQIFFARALAQKGTHKAKRQTLSKAQDAVLEALSVFNLDTAPSYHEAAIQLYDEIEATLETLSSARGVYASA